MNEDIMAISSAFIYKNELIADPGVKERCIQDISKALSTEITLIDNLQSALIWIDTAGACFGDNEESKEIKSEGNKVSLPAILQTASKYNEGECELVKAVYRDLRENQKLTIDDIGIIAPYKAQVDLIRNSLSTYEKGGPRCEVSTVDGFQGREKEIIVLSLVRSNPIKEIGFLADVRRLNVAITRPKRLLVIIGDSSTVTENPFIKVIFEKIKEKGQILTVFEVMDAVKMFDDGEEDEIRKYFNSGTHLTQAHLKQKDSEGKSASEKHTMKKKDQNKKRKKSSAVIASPDNPNETPKSQFVNKEHAELPDLCNNKYSLDNDLYERLKELALTPSTETIKVYRKLENKEKLGLDTYLAENSQMTMKVTKKPYCIVISHLPKKETKEEKMVEILSEEQEDENEDEILEKEKDEERKRKQREKKQRQKEAKKKKKEEEKAIAEMDDDEFFDMLEKEKEKKLAEQKFCPVMIGNTGKKCLKNIQLLGIVCKFCENKFCTTHVHATMHGCDDAEEDFFEQQRKEKLKGLKIGSSGNEPMNEAGMAYLQAKLRRLREEEAQKRKPKAKEENGGEKKTTGTSANEGSSRGGHSKRGGRGSKK